MITILIIFSFVIIFKYVVYALKCNEEWNKTMNTFTPKCKDINKDTDMYWKSGRKIPPPPKKTKINEYD